MATTPLDDGSSAKLDSSVDALLLAALERGDDALHTGRYILAFRPDGADAALASTRNLGIRAADARDFADQSVTFDAVGDADALVLPEIGVAVVSGDAIARAGGAEHMMTTADEQTPYAIYPEHFVFPAGVSGDFLRGFKSAADAIAREAGAGGGFAQEDEDVSTEVLGATWGLNACRVPPSPRSGAGIRVAVLDTGLDLGHPAFAGRPVVGATFVGQPVQDLNGHGTHCTGTAAGPQSPPGTIARYGIAYASSIYIGKVLTNAGSGSSGGVLAGMNWAIANRCQVISMSLGAQGGVYPPYTQAGQAALNAGLLIVAAAGNAGAATGAPANSPTILSVASLDPSLTPSSFSNFGKIDIAAPGRDVFSSLPRPRLYGVLSGTSMACPHVAGCAALWAQTNSTLRGLALWRQLQATARRLPFPANRVGAGLVQAPQT